MRTDKSKLALVLLFVLAAALLPVLDVCGRTALAGFGRNPLPLAEPRNADGQGVGIWSVEDFRNEAQIPVTYEIRKQVSVNAVRLSRRMTVVGTNSVYADIMGYPVLNGGFFTQAAFKTGSREVVLNELAAAALFGGGALAGVTLRINDELWTVAGVIRDEGEAEVIYAPASSYLFDGNAATGGAGGATDGQGAAAGALMILASGHGRADAVLAINRLGDLGVSVSAYSFKTLGKAALSLAEMPESALRFALLAILGLFAWGAAAYAYRNISAAAIRSNAYVNAEGGVRFGALKSILSILFALACAAAAFFLIRDIVEICITWQEIPLVFNAGSFTSGDFSGRIAALGDSQAVITGLFAASVAATAASFIAAARAYILD